MLRFIFTMVIVLALAVCGATVKLGHRTFFGHVRAVWSTDEAQEMKKGVQESAKPMLDKVKRGVEAGYREATKDEGVEAEAPKPAPAPKVEAPAPVAAGEPAPVETPEKTARAEKPAKEPAQVKADPGPREKAKKRRQKKKPTER